MFYQSLQSKSNALQRQNQEFVEKTLPISLSRQKLREQGWILPPTEEEEAYVNYIFYESAKAKRDRAFYGMIDEGKAALMDLAKFSDETYSRNLPFKIPLSETILRTCPVNLVNDSSYMEKPLPPFTNSAGPKKFNQIESELYEAEMQGRLAFQGLYFVLGMGISEGAAAYKLSKATKGLSVLDDTKQFWDDLARYFNKNKETGLWSKNWKPAVEPNLQLFAKETGVGNTIPRGFKDASQVQKCTAELQEALAKSGLDAKSIQVRGSSATGFSRKGGEFRMEAQNGLKPSDVDVGIEFNEPVSGITTSKNQPGFIHPDKMMKNYPDLQVWSEKWSEILGREITPGGWQPGTLPVEPTNIHLTPIDK